MRKTAIVIVIILGVIIVALLVAVLFIPAKRSGAPTNPSPSVVVPVVSDDGNVKVASLGQNDIIRSPFTVEGEARLWYFEASFPVRVLDGDGTELGVGIAQAQGEWMTTDFVPFKATVEFKAPKSANGTVVFQKDNPSGLSEYDAELRVPIRF